MKNQYIILFSVLILAAISIVASFFIYDANLKNISVSIFSSTFVVAVIEAVGIIRDNSKFSFLKGDYVRTKITNKLDNRNVDGSYEDITKRYFDKDINSEISLNYQGSGKYKGTIFYEEGEAEFTIYIDKNNPDIGSGIYQYLKKIGNYKMPDLGAYKIQIDTSNKNSIYVYYANLVPNGLASGYEVWTKKTKLIQIFDDTMSEKTLKIRH